MSSALQDEADPIYSHFGHRTEFLELLEQFMAVDVGCQASKVEDERERDLIGSLGATLDYYLPLPGLLDPSLDAIIPPLMDKLAVVVARLAAGEGAVDQTRLNRLGEVINWVIKVRGWKTIVQHFPSGIHHLSQLVSLLSPPTGPSSSSTPPTPQHPLISSAESWQVRSDLLLWLALLLTVPFSLAAFSDEPASPKLYNLDLVAAERLLSPSLAPLAQRVVMLAVPLLHRPGKEGAYAALVLARVYSRPDAVDALPAFFRWAQAELEEGDRDAEANMVASMLSLLAVLPGMLPPGHLGVIKRFMEDGLLPHLRGSRTAANSSLVRKLAVKARGRWWVSRLTRSAGNKDQTSAGEDGNLDSWLHEGLEEALDDLLSGLADKDTIVRYSSSKYLARICASLPSDFAEQLVSATIDLFAGTEDEPVLYTAAGNVLDPGGNPGGSGQGTMGFGGSETNRGEARWHGVCLAIAELARRGLVKGDIVGQAIPWVLRALTFDIRRATHSIGSNVRDAAAYVLWSLSRACPPETIKPYAQDMATSLISVACLDREVGVRRAASAAYQEGVGRLGLYPEGIDVLAKTDFYSVSVRRIAYTTAVPAVAVHAVYRRKMREYLHGITLRHWDEAMRTAGAVALRDVLELGEDTEMQDAIDREASILSTFGSYPITQVKSLDINDVHGALSALAAIAPSLEADDPRRTQILDSLGTVRPAALVSTQSACALISACNLICATLNQHNYYVRSAEAVEKIASQFTETTMRRREEGCHEAVKDVFAVVSALRTAEGICKMVDKLIMDLKSMRAAQRQSSAVCLGSVQYARYPRGVERAVDALMVQLGTGTKADVETRRYAIRSLASIATQPVSIDAERYERILQILNSSLSDYSTDQRGDVGSWIRVAALKALRLLLLDACSSSSATKVISQDVFEDIISGFVRLGVEKLEPVRAAAAFAWTSLRTGGAAAKWAWEGSDAFIVPAESRMTEDSYDEIFRHTDQQAWFASAMPLLRTQYRTALVQGLVVTIGSQVESLAMLAITPLLATISQSDSLKDGNVMAHRVLSDLAAFMAKEIGSNRVLVPALQTAWRLAVALCVPAKREAGVTGLDDVVIALLPAPLPQTRAAIIKQLSAILSHRFPRIRAMCAEQLYLSLSECLEDELAPELEEMLLETDWTGDEALHRAGEVGKLVESQLLAMG